MCILPERRPYDEREITRWISQVCEEGVLKREAGFYEMTEAGYTLWRVERYLTE
jgi:hypothetical protein